MFNQKSFLSLLATTALLLAPTVSLAQDVDQFSLNDGWEKDIQNAAFNNGATLVANNDSANIAQEVLDAHNRYRSEVNVPTLKWSDALANSSQQWANHLAVNGIFEHSDNQEIGENIWKGTSGTNSVTKMIDSWGAEKKNFTPGVFPDVTTGGEVDHYTQMVWRNTTEVGCALASSNGYDYLVCQYSPSGNYLNQAVY